MSREYARPGVTWQQQVVRREVVIEDGPWDGPAVMTPWDTDVPRPIPGLGQPVEPLNREQRRAVERAKRRKGSKR
jgi:hypothetical protein